MVEPLAHVARRPSPPGWVQAFLGTHPTLADRVAMARAWAAREDR